MIRHSPVLFLLLAAAPVLFVGGCGDPADPGACLDAGRLEGRVVTGRQPVEARITVEQAIEAPTSEPVYQIESDAEGRFGLDLPAGDYTVRVRPSGNHGETYHLAGSEAGLYLDEPDTIAIHAANSPVQVDFVLGTLAVDAVLPRSLEGAEVSVWITLREEIEDRGLIYPHTRGSTRVHDGRVELVLDGLLPGEYRLELEIGRERFWLPGTLDPEESPWHRVAADSATTVAWAAGAEPARLEGRIGGAWLAMGLNRPYLAIFTPDSIPLGHDFPILENGEFGFDLVVPRPLKILVDHGGGLRQWIGGPAFGEATVFDPAPGETIAGIELTACGLRLDQQWAKDLPFWPRIRLLDPADMRELYAGGGYVGPGNVVGIPNLWPGHYLIHFSPGQIQLGRSPWLAQWYDRATEAAEARVVTITDWGEIVRVDVLFEEGGVMEGLLQVAEPGTLDRSIVVTPVDDPVPWGRAFALDGATAFAVRGLPDGDYRLGVLPESSHWNYGLPAPEGTVWWPGTSDWAAAGTLTITGGGTVGDLVVPLD